MDLLNHQQEELHAVICGAFNESELERLVRHRLGRDLHHLVPRGSLSDVVFELIELYKREGAIARLVEAVGQERPANKEVQDVVNRVRMHLAATDLVGTADEEPVTPSHRSGGRQARRT